MDRRQLLAAGLGTTLLNRHFLFAQAGVRAQVPSETTAQPPTQEDEYAFGMASSADIKPWMHEVIKQETTVSNRAANFGLVLSQSKPASTHIVNNSELLLKPNVTSSSHKDTINIWRDTPPNPRYPSAASPEALKTDEALAITSVSGDWSFASIAKVANPSETIVIQGLRNTGAFADDPPMYYTLNQIKVKDVTVPEYFVTDLTSIPRAFCCLLRPDGPYAYAAIAHDWLYWQQDLKREDADWLLKIGMQAFNVSPFVVGVIYEAVRKGGEFAWKSNAALKAKGEKRQMKIPPSDPRVTWADWKKDPSHFTS